MSLQSRFVGCGEGESRRKDSYGDSLPLVERTADAKLERTSLSTGGLQCPLRNPFLLPSPGRLSTGLKTQGRLLPRPPASGLIVSFECGGRYCRGHYVVVNLLPYEGFLGWIQRKIQS